MLQEFRAGLWPHLVDTGNVVGAVADQGQEIDHLLRVHIELRLHAVAVEHRVVHGVDEGDRAVDELRHVLVAGGDEHLLAGLRGATGEGADHVVGFHAGHAQQRQPLRPDDLHQRLDLRAQLIGHPRAVRLVLGEQLVAEGFAGRVEHHGDAARLIVLEELQQHVEHPEERPGRLAARVGQRRQGVERPIDVRGAVDEDQVGGARHGSVQGGAGREYYPLLRRAGVVALVAGLPRRRRRRCRRWRGRLGCGGGRGCCRGGLRRSGLRRRRRGRAGILVGQVQRAFLPAARRQPCRAERGQTDRTPHTYIGRLSRSASQPRTRR